MDTESERIFARMALHRLIEQYPDWSDQRVADEIGKSESWVRKWRSRLIHAEDYTFHIYLSQSRAPKTIWRKTSNEVKKVVGELRESLSEHYHRKAGPKTILHELIRREDLKENGHFIPRSERTIGNILNELGYIMPEPKWDRLPIILPAPNEEWEIDFGQIRIDVETIFEFFIVVDRGTSRVIYVEGNEGYNAETALEAIARLLLVHGLPQRIRMDRDSRFVGAWTRDSYPSPLIRFLRVVGVEPIICPPYRPDKKPVVERTIKTLKEEWLSRHSLNTLTDAHEVLSGFIHYYNTTRIHQGRACNNQIPDEVFPDLPALPALPDTVQPNRWLQDYHGRIFRRRITTNGTIQVDRHTYYIDSDYAKQRVLVHLDASNEIFFVSCEDQVLKQVDVKGLLPSQMDFQTYLLVLKQEARTISWHLHTSWHKVGDVA